MKTLEITRLQSLNLPDEPILGDPVLTAQHQIKLKPADVLKILKEGNRAFADGKLTIKKIRII